MTTAITIKAETVTVQNVLSVRAVAHEAFCVLTFTDRDGATTKVFFDGVLVADAMARAYEDATKPKTADALIAEIEGAA
jgi:hypothetical protein